MRVLLHTGHEHTPAATEAASFGTVETVLLGVGIFVAVLAIAYGISFFRSVQ